MVFAAFLFYLTVVFILCPNNLSLNTLDYKLKAHRLTIKNDRNYIWDKVFKNGPSEYRGRQTLKKLKDMVVDHVTSN